MVRGFLSRVRVSKLFEKKRFARQRLDLVSSYSLDDRARMVQVIIRGFVDRRRVVNMRLRHRSAKLIQMISRQKLARIRARCIVGEKRRRLLAARAIQRVFRGHKGRKRFKYFAVRRHHKQIQERFVSSKSTMEYYFEQNGAASRIQRWYII